jgi:DNA-binding transcriptional LysR family regulator
MDRLDRLRAFVLVAERTSFSEAARTLRVSPTAISRAVAALERELGVQLLRRTTRSVRLTDEGSTYLERSRRALAELDEAARLVVGEDAEPQGTLIVSAPVVFGRLHVMPIVANLLARYPQLAIRLTLTDRIVRIIDEGVDVAVRIAALPDSSLRATRIAEVRRVLVASPGYLRERGTPRKLEELRDHDLIAFDQLSRNDEWRFDEHGVVIRLQPRLATNSVDATIEAAAMSCGIARVLSYQVRRHLDDRRLVQVLPKVSTQGVPVNVVHAAQRHPSPAVRAFTAAAREAMKE